VKPCFRGWLGSGRWRVWSAGLCLLVVLLSGCGLGVPTQEPVTITFVYPDVDNAYYEPLAQQFNESHPYITVELEPRPWDVLDQLGTEDVDVITADAFVLYALRQQGDILSLEPFVEQDAFLDVADFYPGTLEALSSEGEVWAIPAGVDVQVMYYSQDLFDQNAVPYPQVGWTWDDFLNSALAVNDPEAGLYGYVSPPGHFDAVLFIYQHGGRIVDDLRDPTRPTFDDPLTIEALDWYARLFHEYDVAPTDQEARQAFGSGRYAVYDGLRHGRVGMWMGDLSERGGLTWSVEWFVEWGMAPLPSESQSITNAAVEGYAISAETGHLDASWEWILFLSQQVTYRLMPPRCSLAESSAYEQQVGQAVAAVATASMEHAVLLPPAVWTRFGGAMDTFGQAVDRIISEESTPQEAMLWVQQQTEASMTGQ
jgi:multiple sugar transport system substrate-binding protein